MVDRKEFRFEFGCPRCPARLRLKDRSLVGTQWTCPECGCALRIDDAGEGQIAAIDVTPVASKVSPIRRLRISPRVAAGLVAGVLVAGLAVFVTQRPDVRHPVAAEPGIPQAEPVPAVPEVPPLVRPLTPVPAVALMEAIGRWLTTQRERNGAFPSGTIGEGPLEERFGWQAQFREEMAGTPIPDRAQGWRSPINDPFVRRKAAELLLPGLPIASEAGFPASHFAGVAGVGAEAASLPKSDPRAGIFGDDRRTTAADIRDGLSNTLMIVGAESRPPTWASGTEGVRSLTSEPYFNGPDGLGTGQKDGMYVLLADGSVKFLSSDTDPKILRRMAAMADGLPLDATVPGEPIALRETPPDETPDIANQGPPAAKNDPPITVELAPDQPPIDVAKQLAIPIRRFRITQPTPLRTVLRQLVEMTAVPVDPSAIELTDRLDQLVTLDHQDGPLTEILAAILQQAGLTYTIDSGTVRLAVAPSPPPPTAPSEKSSPPAP